MGLGFQADSWSGRDFFPAHTERSHDLRLVTFLVLDENLQSAGFERLDVVRAEIVQERVPIVPGYLDLSSVTQLDKDGISLSRMILSGRIAEMSCRRSVRG